MSIVHHLCKESSLATLYLNELRDNVVQKNRLLFRSNLYKLGFLLAQEVSKNLEYEPIEIATPLGIKQSVHLKNEPVLLTILRAGLPLMNAFADAYPKADAGFIGAYRKPVEEGSAHGGEFHIAIDYKAIPNLNKKDVILVDTMLATGRSLVDTVKLLQKQYEFKHLHIASVIAAPEGIAYVQENLPNAQLYIADIDAHLDANQYIVPGLGDAGDLCYGEKL